MSVLAVFLVGVIIVIGFDGGYEGGEVITGLLTDWDGS